MEGRDRSGADARGTIGDAELIDKQSTTKAARKVGAHLSFTALPRRLIGIGLLAILAGVCIWLWPSFDLYVVSYLKILDTGPQIIGWGFVLITAAVLAKMLLFPILNIIIR